MIPIRDHNETRTTPLVTWLLIAANTLIFIFMFSMSRAKLDSFVNSYALIPRNVVNGADLHTLLTSMFLHGGIGHIFSNMIFLHVFGDNLEDRYGHIGFALFYLISGLCASALQIFVNPASAIPNLGASGAIAGLLGGISVIVSKTQDRCSSTFRRLCQISTSPRIYNASILDNISIPAGIWHYRR